MRCVWKVTRLVSQTIYFNFKQQTTWFHFQEIYFKSNALTYFSLPRFYALFKEFFYDILQLRRYGPFDGFHAFKTDSLHLEWRRKSHGAKSGE